MDNSALPRIAAVEIPRLGILAERITKYNIRPERAFSVSARIEPAEPGKRPERGP